MKQSQSTDSGTSFGWGHHEEEEEVTQDAQ